MRSRTLLLALVVTTGAVALPYIAHAAIPFFDPIIPQGGNFASCPAGWGMLITVINNIIQLLITLAIVFVAPIMIAWSGFLFVVNPVNASGKDKAKKILTNTIVGIVIALAGWLIVDAIMAVLYSRSSGASRWGTWSQLITSGGIAHDCLQQVGAPIQTGHVPTPPPTVVTVPTVTDEQTIRQQLAAAGITINHAACPVGSSGSGCTNVGGMKSATVSQIIAIKQSCSGCTVIVTGGTEPGHASGTYSHGNGYKVDIGLNTNLNNFLQKLPLTGQRGGDFSGPIRQDSCGNQYVQESSHWDIKILQTCSLPAN